jgi:putative hemolysin
VLATISRAVWALAASAVFVALPLRAQTAASSTRTVGLANPASKNCTDKGGTLTIEKNGAGGEFGVCTFANNLQCEEWALLRGDCRAGGIKVTGYVTPAARYCALTGGVHLAASGSAGEQGSCTLKGGKVCAAGAHFDGTCTREADAESTTVRASFTCDAGKNVAAIFTNGPRSSVALVLSDGRKVSLPQAMSGSGARYANGDESFVFWNKGNTAFIEENGKTTYSGCVASRG